MICILYGTIQHTFMWPNIHVCIHDILYAYITFIHDIHTYIHSTYIHSCMSCMCTPSRQNVGRLPNNVNNKLNCYSLRLCTYIHISRSLEAMHMHMIEVIPK